MLFSISLVESWLLFILLFICGAPVMSLALKNFQYLGVLVDSTLSPKSLKVILFSVPISYPVSPSKP